MVVKKEAKISQNVEVTIFTSIVFIFY